MNMRSSLLHSKHRKKNKLSFLKTWILIHEIQLLKVLINFQKKYGRGEMAWTTWIALCLQQKWMWRIRTEKQEARRRRQCQHLKTSRVSTWRGGCGSRGAPVRTGSWRQAATSAETAPCPPSAARPVPGAWGAEVSPGHHGATSAADTGGGLCQEVSPSPTWATRLSVCTGNHGESYILF